MPPLLLWDQLLAPLKKEELWQFNHAKVGSPGLPQVCQLSVIAPWGIDSASNPGNDHESSNFCQKCASVTEIITTPCEGFKRWVEFHLLCFSSRHLCRLSLCVSFPVGAFLWFKCKLSGKNWDFWAKSQIWAVVRTAAWLGSPLSALFPNLSFVKQGLAQTLTEQGLGFGA